MTLTQTAAIFYDAYRALRARKMFWIVLALSGLVVAALGAFGINERGITLFGWTMPSVFNTTLMSREAWYKYLFASFAVPVWLAWIAVVLALISTASIFPELMTSGSIDLVLCKPIGRVRLFLTQYAAGLMFVVLQVFVFCLAGFLVIGIRGGAWEPGLFIAVPLVVCLFSYLFAVCVFWGVVTRSTVAAILLTLLVWFLVWGLHTTDAVILNFQTIEETRADRMERGIGLLQARADALRRTQATQPATQPAQELTELTERVADLKDKRAAAVESAKGLGTAQRVVYWVKTFLPKTAETVALTDRALIRLGDLPNVRRSQESISLGDNFEKPEPARAAVAVAQKIRSRSTAWIVGTSLAFEAVVLALSAWIFCRRDF